MANPFSWDERVVTGEKPYRGWRGEPRAQANPAGGRGPTLDELRARELAQEERRHPGPSLIKSAKP